MDKLRKVQSNIKQKKASSESDKEFKESSSDSTTENQKETSDVNKDSKSKSEDDDVKQAKDIINKNKEVHSSIDSDVIDKAVQPFSNINNHTDLKEHIKQAVEESVKKEVSDTLAKYGNA